MLLKSTGSLRRKRAENSPVWRKGSRVGGIHERAAWLQAAYKNSPTFTYKWQVSVKVKPSWVQVKLRPCFWPFTLT